MREGGSTYLVHNEMNFIHEALSRGSGPESQSACLPSPVTSPATPSLQTIPYIYNWKFFGESLNMHAVLNLSTFAHT